MNSALINEYIAQIGSLFNSRYPQEGEKELDRDQVTRSKKNKEFLFILK